jgi:hypothetical protein
MITRRFRTKFFEELKILIIAHDSYVRTKPTICLIIDLNWRVCSDRFPHTLIIYYAPRAGWGSGAELWSIFAASKQSLSTASLELPDASTGWKPTDGFEPLRAARGLRFSSKYCQKHTASNRYREVVTCLPIDDGFTRFSVTARSPKGAIVPGNAHWYSFIHYLDDSAHSHIEKIIPLSVVVDALCADFRPTHSHNNRGVVVRVVDSEAGDLGRDCLH